MSRKYNFLIGFVVFFIGMSIGIRVEASEVLPPVEVEEVVEAEAGTIDMATGMETKILFGEVRYQSYTTPNGVKIYTTKPEARWEEFIISAIDAAGITNEMTEYEKCVAVNDYVKAVVDPISLQPGEVAPADHPLKCGTGTCFEYSDAFQTMLCAVGIESYVVDGNCGGSHKWNRVLADGVWYYNDVMANDNETSPTRCLMSTELWPGFYIYEHNY